MSHFADRLLGAIRRTGAPVCVGIDPVYERLPAALLDPRPDPSASARLTAIASFVQRVLAAVGPHVPCVKFQSACFERYGAAGVAAARRLMGMARDAGMLVIHDVKRGDIGTSARHYADACLRDGADGPAPDAMTVNAWCGLDGIEPFIDVAAETGRGLFVWVRASNRSSDALQGLHLGDGRTVAEALAALVASAGDVDGLVGDGGYSLVGAVVGATKAREAAALRRLMPRQLFLVPGFGAQGAGAADVRACFGADGTGALITASRSILYAFDPDDRHWPAAVESAAVRMKGQIAEMLAGLNGGNAVGP